MDRGVVAHECTVNVFPLPYRAENHKAGITEPFADLFAFAQSRDLAVAFCFRLRHAADHDDQPDQNAPTRTE